MITTISFDGDNTLWDFEKVMHHSLECVRLELASIPELKSISVEEMILTRNQVADSLKGKVTNLEEIRLSAFLETLRQNGVDDLELAKKLNETYLKHRFEDIELYDDVSPALERLQKYRIGLISNGNSYPERCGLADTFEFVVFSQDHGFEKPDKRIFDVALSKAECRSSEILHVGDSLKSDVFGAKTASILSVWLNRNKEVNRTDIQPDFVITSLAELPTIVSSINERKVELVGP